MVLEYIIVCCIVARKGYFVKSLGWLSELAPLVKTPRSCRNCNRRLPFGRSRCLVVLYINYFIDIDIFN